MLTICLAVIIVFLYVLYSYITRTRVTNPIPGPPGWPILGCLFEIEPSRLHFNFDRWAKKYGPLILCRMATTNMVVISCPRMVKKAFMEKGYSDVLNDRPDSFFGKYIMDDAKGVIFGKYGQTLNHLRKIMYKGLNMYGEGIQQFELLAQKELEMVLKSITDLGGRDFDPSMLLSRSLTNLILIMLTGSMADEAGAELIWKYDNSINQTIVLSTEVMLWAFPFLRFLPVEVGRRYRRSMEAKKELLNKYYLSQKETYEPGRERGLVDVLFKLQEQENHEGEKQWLTDSQIKAFIQDIIAAGLITTRNGLLCILLVLLHHHECVDGIYQEIIKVVGLDRYPSMQDRPAMPYTESVILEALRYVTHVPLSVPHGAMEDVEFEGYTIPRLASDALALLAEYLRDQKRPFMVHNEMVVGCGDIVPTGIHNHQYMDNSSRSCNMGRPLDNRPERFLDDNGKLLPADHTLRQSLMIFGAGKRVCVGENLAKSRIFLYLTTIIQKFDLLPPEVGTLPSDDSRTFLPGMVLRPQDYKMRGIAR